uniref:C-type lectin domain-containing protein n=1 Tax=Labrus bergylta TaxID=56723 RepID=A0A3Q3GA87_9LABR
TVKIIYLNLLFVIFSSSKLRQWLYHFAISLHYKQYHFISQSKTWGNALQHCRTKYTDLATVNNQQDLEDLASLTGSSVTQVFLGLYRPWGWSRSDADDYREEEPAYWNWEKSSFPYTDCGLIARNGLWSPKACTSRPYAWPTLA